MPFSSFSKFETFVRSFLSCPPNFLTLYPNLPKFFWLLCSLSKSIILSLSNKFSDPFRTKQSFPAFPLLLPAPPSKRIFLLLSRFCVTKAQNKKKLAERRGYEYLHIRISCPTYIPENTLKVTFYYLCRMGRLLLSFHVSWRLTHSETSLLRLSRML